MRCGFLTSTNTLSATFFTFFFLSFYYSNFEIEWISELVRSVRVCVSLTKRQRESERPLAHSRPLFGTVDLSSSPSSIPFTGYSTSLTRATDEPETILMRNPPQAPYLVPSHHPLTPHFPLHNRGKYSTTSQPEVEDRGCANFVSRLNNERHRGGGESLRGV